ncbi:MAG: hypothetical protein ISS35_06450 [Kiritimatiellae bacterium]|nr:hypothetical protein [Kiritimatiellia bacterium]
MKAIRILSFFMVLAFAASAVMAGGVKYQNEDGHYLKLGGRIQLQYHMEDPDDGESTDELKFRRFRPYIEGSVHQDWKGKFQWDMGKGDTEVKDAYFQFSGWDGIKVTIGNANFPFSREFLTSSKKQQFVERTFVGDHNYGTPDRQAGVHVEGSLSDKLITWAVSGGVGSVDPDNKKLDMDTTVSLNKGDDWSDGPIIGGRVELFPMGYFKPEQGDLKKGDFKAAVAVAAFAWENDEDNLDSDMVEADDGAMTRKVGKQDVDSITGVEISAAVRGAGLSVDAEYNTFDSELVAGGINSGLYSDSETTLENWSVEGGYMILPGKLEVVAGYQVQDADGYSDEWTRSSVGANLFVKKHDIKYQVTYQVGENKDGKDGNDVDELFVQAQYVF